MSIFGCIDLSQNFTRAAQTQDVLEALRYANGDRAQLALALARGSLDPTDHPLFDAETSGMPAGVWNAVGDLIVTSADHGVPFRFQSAAPESVMEFARKRRMRFTFDVEEEQIAITFQHTLRHPTWLPEVVLPEPVEMVAQIA